MQQNTCRGCLRYERRDGSWAVVEPESKELLALLLKKPRGLGAVRLADAKRWFRDLRREHVLADFSTSDFVSLKCDCTL